MNEKTVEEQKKAYEKKIINYLQEKKIEPNQENITALKNQASTGSAEEFDYYLKNGFLPKKKIVQALSKELNWKTIAEEIAKQNKFFYDKTGLWWIWNEIRCCYEKIDETDLLNMIDEAIDADTIKPGVKLIVLEAFRRVGRKNIPKEAPSNWIQFKNKIYDLTNDKVFESTPEYNHTNPIPWELGEKEDTPTIDALFKDWCPENQDILYEIISYSMIRDYPISRIFVLIGAGRNGKSSYLEIFRKFIGINNSASAQLDVLVENRFQAAKIFRKLVCFMGETNFDKLKNTDLIKRLTGRDMIDIEFKGKDGFNYINYAKIVIATNNLPPTQDKTEGFYRRWTIIEFKGKFEEKEDILSKIPDEEYCALAKKLLRYLKSLLNKREFNKEGDIENRRVIYEKKSDPLQAFIDEYYVESTGNVAASQFVDDFSRYCQERGHRAFNYFTVRSLMKEKGYTYNKHLPPGYSNPVSCIENISKKEFASSLSRFSSSSIPPYTRIGGVESLEKVETLESNPPKSSDNDKICVETTENHVSDLDKVRSFVRKHPKNNRWHIEQVFGIDKLSLWLNKGDLISLDAETIYF